VIIAACLALLVCGTCTCSHPKRTYTYMYIPQLAWHCTRPYVCVCVYIYIYIYKR
jgi:hypothetical protein